MNMCLRRTKLLLFLLTMPVVVLAQPNTPDAGSDGQPRNLTRVTGIGGVFIRANNPAMLRAWYTEHLGIDVEPWGGKPFRWVDSAGQPTGGTTVWHIGSGKNFAPSTSSFMINFRVADLHALLDALRAEGCEVVGDPVDSEDGNFGWVMDPEGNKIELWEPPPGR